jgi:uncharacterized membrane protein YfcA
VAVQVLVAHRGRVADGLEVREDGDRRQHAADVGLGVGLLVGATGVGGGSIMTPLLVVVAGVPPIRLRTDTAHKPSLRRRIDRTG